jgi:hypothetical protein
MQNKNLLKNLYLSIDPGLNTAIAVWTNDNILITTIEFTINKYKHKKIMTLEHKLTLMRLFLSSKIGKYINHINRVHIESVELWSGSSISYISGIRGDLFLLSYLVGIYFEFFISKNINTYLIPATKWKGQLSYGALLMKVANILGLDESMYSEHEINALGLGLYTQGRF